MKTPMKKSIDLRLRVNKLIEAIDAVPPKHLAPAMVKLRADLKNAVAEYDKEMEE